MFVNVVRQNMSVSVPMTSKLQCKEQCPHLYEDLSICGRKNGYNSTTHCEKHFHDINCDRVESKTQEIRLKRLKKTNYQLFHAERSILP
jgi:hypothetical protein